MFEDNADDYFELYDNEDVVVIFPYDGDMDDRVLEEMRPRFVIMYEPNPSFIRRVEVYPILKLSHIGLSSFSSLASFESLFPVLFQFRGGTEVPLRREERKRCVHTTYPRERKYGPGNSK